MAKLSTSSHPCEQVYLPSPTGVTARCPQAAYRRHEGKWLCRTHTQRAKARALNNA